MKQHFGICFFFYCCRYYMFVCDNYRNILEIFYPCGVLLAKRWFLITRAALATSRNKSVAKVLVILLLNYLWVRQTGIEISYIQRDLITVIFYYQISLKPLKTLSLSQVSFPLLFPLYYIVPWVFTNSDKGKNKGKKIL